MAYSNTYIRAISLNGLLQHLHSKMYKDNDTKCKLGCSHIDSQDNVLKCDAIKALSAEKLDQSCYENIFGRNIVQINEAAKVLAKAMEIREAIVNPITTDD